MLYIATKPTIHVSHSLLIRSTEKGKSAQCSWVNTHLYMPCFAYIMLLLLYIATVYILNFLRTKIFVHGLLNFLRKRNLQNKNFMDRLPSTHSYTHIYVASFQGWKCHSCLTNHDMHVNFNPQKVLLGHMVQVHLPVWPQ